MAKKASKGISTTSGASASRAQADRDRNAHASQSAGKASGPAQSTAETKKCHLGGGERKSLLGSSGICYSRNRTQLAHH